MKKRSEATQILRAGTKGNHKQTNTQRNSQTDRSDYNTPRSLARSVTSCARGDTICLLPLQVDNIFAFIRQVAPVPECWLFKTSATSWPLTFWPWKWCPNHVWRGLPVCQF